MSACSRQARPFGIKPESWACRCMIIGDHSSRLGADPAGTAGPDRPVPCRRRRRLAQRCRSARTDAAPVTGDIATVAKAYTAKGFGLPGLVLCPSARVRCLCRFATVWRFWVTRASAGPIGINTVFIFLCVFGLVIALFDLCRNDGNGGDLRPGGRLQRRADQSLRRKIAGIIPMGLFGLAGLYCHPRHLDMGTIWRTDLMQPMRRSSSWD